jgi:creatinine amidohydrolase
MMATEMPTSSKGKPGARAGEAMLLEEMGWPDVQDYLTRDDRLMMVAGSTEQHGRHLTFASDVWIPWEVARRASAQTGVLLAPPVAYGMSLHHLGFPGSLALRPETLTHVVVDLLDSAYVGGFRRVLVVNGHGGNTASIQVALAKVLHERGDLQAGLINWWSDPSVAAVFDAAFGDQPAHADAGETSAVLAVRPDVVQMERAQHSPHVRTGGPLSVAVFERHYPHGAIGADPRRASAEVGERALEAAAAVCMRWLEETSASQ